MKGFPPAGTIFGMLRNGRVSAHIKSIAQHLVFFVSALWTLFPPVPIHMQHGLDSSWVIGLNLAINQGLQFGKEIIFTYGPLGFISLPKLFSVEYWHISFYSNLAIHCFFFYTVYLFLKRSNATFLDHLFLCVSIVFASTFFCNDYKVLLAVPLLLYLSISDRLRFKEQTRAIIVCMFFLAVVSLIKFSATILSLNIVMLFALYSLFIRNKKHALTAIVTFLGVLIGLWIISGQNIWNIYDYVVLSYNLSTAYNASMQTEGPTWQIYFAIVTIMLFLLSGYAAAHNRMKNVMFFLAMNAGLIFFSFKHGFIRHQTHAYVFFSNMLILLPVLNIIQKRDSFLRTTRLYPVFGAFLMVILFQNPFLPMFRPMEKISQAKESLSLALHPEKCEKAIADTKKLLQNQMVIDNDSLQSIQSKTIDIIPWDTSLVFAYDLNWLPRPVFHSYAAASKKLDGVNANHFKRADAPEIVLYAFKTIDDRYPVFDEPATFRTLLSHYVLLSISNDFAILKRKERIPDEKLVFLSKGSYTTGERILVPSYNAGYLFGKIHVAYNVLGKIIQFLYKPSKVYITFFTNDGNKSKRFRFVAGNAENGVFLSQHLSYGINDLFSLFSGKIDENRIIRGIQIDVDHKWQFETDINVEFFGMLVKPGEALN